MSRFVPVSKRGKHAWLKRMVGAALAWVLLLVLLTAQTVSAAQPQLELHDFSTGSRQAIEQEHKGEPFVLVLWSLTCPPCMHELDLLGEWLIAHPDQKLVLITTDPAEDAEQVRQKLTQSGLTAADNWRFADSYVEKLRYDIDPSWRGELPRSYFYSANGARRPLSGAIKPAHLEHWLNQQRADN